jgi:glycosyltransferase involved in cell wall biosynthesis
MHERLLGRDYPLFATSEEDVVARVLDAVEDPSIRAAAAGRLLAAAEDHTFERSTERLRTILERAFPSPLRAGGSERKLRIAVASHDLKFFSAILQRLTATPDVEVRVDEWPALDRHDEERSRALAAWADVVICEWCGPNAIWYSRHKRRGQRLIVRLHRFELDRPWPARLAIENVDRVVAVSQSYATLMQRTLGWPADLIEVISNWVDDGSLDRPKLAGAQFHLGFIGMAPARKRLDRALDVLEWLRTADPRYRLFVKSKLSWEYPWLWVRPDERIHADLVMRRIQTSPLLRGSVVFDGFGPDVAGWLRGIGFILSTSEDESFHLAPAEGMAAGSVPAILDWPGAASIYDQHWIHASTSAIGEYIASTVSGGRWDAERELARAQSREHFGLDRILDEWAHMILDVLGSPARTAVPSHR